MVVVIAIIIGENLNKYVPRDVFNVISEGGDNIISESGDQIISQ